MSTTQLTLEPGEPLADLCDRIREARAGSTVPFTVALQPGVYLLNAPLALSDTSDITLLGSGEVSIETSSQITGPAIRIENSSRIRLKHLTIHGAGISVSGGNRATLEKADYVIEDCELHSGTDAAISLNGVGTRIRNCHIHDWAGIAIDVSGNEHHIERTAIHDTETGIRAGGDWTERGLSITHNRIHDATIAIDLDDFASGSVIQGNVFHDTKAIVIRGGRNHRIANNIFVDCVPAIDVEARGMSESETVKARLTELRQTFDARKPLTPPYSIRYPDLKEVAAYYFHELGIPPEGNLITRNICVGDWIETDNPVTRKLLATQNNFLDGDPGFADIGARNFHLPEDAEVYELGFKPIPLDEIGRVKSAG